MRVRQDRTVTGFTGRPRPTLRQGGEVDACLELVRLAEIESAGDPPPKKFVRALALNGAGVRGGIAGVFDLARGGRNIFSGGGFRLLFTDGTSGQVRHFCGVLGACAVLGPLSTRWVSIVIRHDSPRSADGHLTDAAVELYRSLMAGSVSVQQASTWIHDNVCANPITRPAPRSSPSD